MRPGFIADMQNVSIHVGSVQEAPNATSKNPLCGSITSIKEGVEDPPNQVSGYGRWILANVACQRPLSGDFVTVQREQYSDDHALGHTTTNTTFRLGYVEVTYKKGPWNSLLQKEALQEGPLITCVLILMPKCAFTVQAICLS